MPRAPRSGKQPGTAFAPDHGVENATTQPTVLAAGTDGPDSAERRFGRLLGGLVLRATFYALLCAVFALLVGSAFISQ